MPIDNKTLAALLAASHSSGGGGGGESSGGSGGGNVVCDTLIDTTVTENVQGVKVTVPNIDDYFAFYIGAEIAICDALTAAGDGVISLRGNEVMRDKIIPYPGVTPSNYGKIAIVCNVLEGSVTGTSFIRKANFTNAAIGNALDLASANTQLISLSTWGSNYFAPGTRFVVLGLRKA